MSTSARRFLTEICFSHHSLPVENKNGSWTVKETSYNKLSPQTPGNEYRRLIENLFL